MNNRKKRVVVIGGGFAGAYVARKLERVFKVTLVDTKNYFEFTPSILRTIVDPAHVKKIQVLHTHYLKRAKVVLGDVRRITEKEVGVKKTRIPFDYCVITSGSYYSPPFKQGHIVISARGDILRDSYDDLCEAKRVLIAGGGLVSVELAAEILTHYPEKKVTIVHSRKELIQRNPKKARRYVYRFLKRHGAEIHLDERIRSGKGKTFLTDKGRTIKADLYFKATGIQPNIKFLQKAFPDAIIKYKYLQIRDTLQLEGHPHIFVAGDIAGIKEEKTAQNAEEHAAVVVHNICALEEGKSLGEYVAKSRIMLISLGKYDGLLTYKGRTITGIIPSLLKAFVEWKTMLRYR